MRQLFLKLWNDDDGFVIALEYILIATIIILGLIAGLASIRDAVNSELSELGNSFMALSQGYVLCGHSACCAMVDGSQACDTPCAVSHGGGGYGHGCGYGNGGPGPRGLYYGNGCCDGLWGGYQGGWNGAGCSGCTTGGGGCGGGACQYEHCLPTN
jgi:Flp pilus assembly pilin Flp